MEQYKIDFVLPWVNGDDPQWIEQRDLYSQKPTSDARENRYRDWGLLKYWFRGIERYAPWVNKIYFITSGHYPSWLNLEHPKLSLIKHTDYIPKEYLPCFSSHPIELNLHRIEELSEHFVYFNDDIFLMNPIEPRDFFMNGLPCDSPKMAPIFGKNKVLFPHILMNTVGAINSKFSKQQVIKDNFIKWFHPRYGVKANIRNLFFYKMKGDKFPGFVDPHLALPYVKSTLFDVWDSYHEILDQTSSHKFRDILDVNQYIFRYWQFAKGDFYPSNTDKLGKLFWVPLGSLKLYKEIKDSKYKMICINDLKPNFDVESEISTISNLFEMKLSKKSSFEK